MGPAPAPIGLRGALAIAVGTTIGAGVFAFTGPATAQAGAGLPWAFVLGAVPMALALVPVAALGAALPTAGGNYAYPSRLLSPRLAFMGVWAYAFGAAFGFFPLYALLCTDFLRAYWPGLPAVPVAAAILTALWIVNVQGVRLATAVQGAMVASMLVALAAYATAGVSALVPGNLGAPWPHGAGGLLVGASLLTFAYSGGNALVEMGHEIGTPARVIPRAMGLCFAIVLVLYVAVGVATVGASPWTVAATKGMGAAAARVLGPRMTAYFVLGGALMAIATSLNGAFLWGTKSLQVLCADGFLPKVWGDAHPRTGTPARLLTGIWALSIAGLLAPMERVTLNATATIGSLAIFVPVLAAAAVLPRRCPEAWRKSPFRPPVGLVYACAGVGVLLCLAAMATLVVELVDRTALWLMAAWLAAGVAWMVRAGRGVSVKREGDWK